jgi:hypothetical protein
MKTPNNSTPDPIDKFLQKLEEDAQANGYPSGIMLNMRHDPAMMDILVRMLGAELKAIKEERKVAASELRETNPAS